MKKFFNLFLKQFSAITDLTLRCHLGGVGSDILVGFVCMMIINLGCSSCCYGNV